MLEQTVIRLCARLGSRGEMNQLYDGDNLDVLRDRSNFPDASVDLVSLDPPFNANRS